MLRRLKKALRVRLARILGHWASALGETRGADTGRPDVSPARPTSQDAPQPSAESRLVDWNMPSPLSPGARNGPPAHWVELVRQRAPQLLRTEYRASPGSPGDTEAGLQHQAPGITAPGSGSHPAPSGGADTTGLRAETPVPAEQTSPEETPSPHRALDEGKNPPRQHRRQPAPSPAGVTPPGTRSVHGPLTARHGGQAQDTGGPKSSSPGDARAPRAATERAPAGGRDAETWTQSVTTEPRGPEQVHRPEVKPVAAAATVPKPTPASEPDYGPEPKPRMGLAGPDIPPPRPGRRPGTPVDMPLNQGRSPRREAAPRPPSDGRPVSRQAPAPQAVPEARQAGEQPAHQTTPAATPRPPRPPVTGESSSSPRREPRTPAHSAAEGSPVGRFARTPDTGVPPGAWAVGAALERGETARSSASSPPRVPVWPALPDEQVPGGNDTNPWPSLPDDAVTRDTRLPSADMPLALSMQGDELERRRRLNREQRGQLWNV